MVRIASQEECIIVLLVLSSLQATQSKIHRIGQLFSSILSPFSTTQASVRDDRNKIMFDLTKQ